MSQQPKNEKLIKELEDELELRYHELAVFRDQEQTLKEKIAQKLERIDYIRNELEDEEASEDDVTPSETVACLKQVSKQLRGITS